MSDNNEKMVLKTSTEQTAGGAYANTQPPREDKVPLLGLFAVGFALLSIFTFAPVFVPLGLIFGVIAVLIGQIGLGMGAIFLSVIGIVTSPTLMAVVGIGAFFAWLGL